MLLIHIEHNILQIYIATCLFIFIYYFHTKFKNCYIFRQISIWRRVTKKCTDIRVINHLPPPFFWHKYGNLQTFPKPTARPMDARRNSALFPQVSRCFTSSPTASDEEPTAKVSKSLLKQF